MRCSVLPLFVESATASASHPARLGVLTAVLGHTSIYGHHRTVTWSVTWTPEPVTLERHLGASLVDWSVHGSHRPSSRCTSRERGLAWSRAVASSVSVRPERCTFLERSIVENRQLIGASLCTLDWRIGACARTERVTLQHGHYAHPCSLLIRRVARVLARWRASPCYVANVVTP